MVLGEHIGCWVSNPGWLYARQTPYVLDYCFGPIWCFFLKWFLCPIFLELQRLPPLYLTRQVTVINKCESMSDSHELRRWWAEWYSVSYICDFFISTCIIGYLGCFHILPIVSLTALDIDYGASFHQTLHQMLFSQNIS